MLTLSDVAAAFSTWHIARAAGLTAYLLLFTVTASGLLQSLRLIDAKHRPRLARLHQKSLYSLLLFTLLHALILLFDKHVSFSLADVLIPYWSDAYSWPLALGILAFYALLTIAITTVPAIIKLSGAKLWRYAHYLAFPAYWLALYHGFTLGSDSGNKFVLALYAVTGGLTACLTLLRIGYSLKKRGYYDADTARGR
ncbi:ferric reductase-like transmembrane domain-containing protein [Azotosporobacter soli]|uniref:ferric reductase-like transmembrane domain-containing protein n=1 Tax=Azotosporobacter soli TaxID=3055040 RepID=UPI0031FF2708